MPLPERCLWAGSASFFAVVHVTLSKPFAACPSYVQNFLGAGIAANCTTGVCAKRGALSMGG